MPSLPTNEFQQVTDLKTEIIDYIKLRLGDQMIDVELDREHYMEAIKQALKRYRANRTRGRRIIRIPNPN